MSHTQAILIIARCFSATYNIILLNIVKWNTFVMSYPKETLIIALYFFYASNLISSGVVGWPEFSWLTCQPSETSAAECSSLKSPLASLLCHLMERSIYRRGRARERPVENTDADDPNFPGHGLQQGRLWGPEDDDIRGFEAWSSVRDCYNEALGKTPNHLSVICSPTIDMQSQYSIQSLYAPTSWSWAHNPWLNGLSELDFNSHRQNYGNVKTGTMARVSVNLRFQQHSTSGKPSPKFRLLGHLPLDFRSNSDLKSRRLNWMRHTKWFLKYCLLSFFPSLAYVATAAAIPSHHNFALDSRQVEVPGSDDGGLAWFWYLTIVASILVGEFTAAYILKDPLLLHGVSMGLSAASYLLMVFGQDKIPFHTQIRQASFYWAYINNASSKHY
ncbi:hypothetical protein F4859DRAFT_510268 [Xylaria cf. heliscus]|nr:hypothetical protein F4859DRAFT_510268 [Xylaria cf. heliscus]